MFNDNRKLGPDVVTLGETMAAIRAEEVGLLRHAQNLRLSIAGAESNVAIGVTRLGATSAWMGRVGNDELGARVLRELRAEGVQVRAIVDEDAPTGLMIKERRAAEITRVHYYRHGSAGSRLQPTDLDEDLIRSSSVLHITGVTPALGDGPAKSVQCAIDIARNAGVIVTFDLNYRSTIWPPEKAGPVLRTLVKQSDVVFASELEASLVIGAGHEALDAVSELAKLGPRQAVVKRGRLGAVAMIDEEIISADALAVQALDPVGAGDAFAAGYLVRLIEGVDPHSRLETASAAGAFAVTAAGDWEGLPRRNEMSLLLSPDYVAR